MADDTSSAVLKTPKEFNFQHCLQFLARSPLEPCHRVQNNTLYKLEKIDGQMVLMKIGACRDQSIRIDFLTPRPEKCGQAAIEPERKTDSRRCHPLLQKLAGVASLRHILFVGIAHRQKPDNNEDELAVIP
jgi:hypothetical protein